MTVSEARKWAKIVLYGAHIGYLSLILGLLWAALAHFTFWNVFYVVVFTAFLWLPLSFAYISLKIRLRRGDFRVRIGLD